MRSLLALVDRKTPQGRVFDRIVYILILWSILSFALETLPEAGQYTTFFNWSERIVVAIFTFELLLRTKAKGWKYVLTYYGLIDVLAIAPFYLSMGFVDLRVIRVLRLLRLLRIAKLQRFGTASQRLLAALSEVKDELVVYGILTALILFIASVGIYYCEHDAQPETFSSVFHSMWWAVATLSTVGYGDVYPVTTMGKLFTGLVLILGLGIVAVPSGLIASALVQQPNPEKQPTPTTNAPPDTPTPND